MYRINRILHPEIFQGRDKHSKYFEGWYFKLVDRDAMHSCAVIPGISTGTSRKDSHSFIQYISSSSGKTEYISYGYDEFSFSDNKFEISIGPNRFSAEGISLSAKEGAFPLSGELHFDNIVKYKPGIWPGIMGPYSFVPFMECFHGIVNVKHDVSGTLSAGDMKTDFTGGKGYIEKDWGRSFPEEWIWMQAGDFPDESVTVMFSVARIPWFGRHFPGFISFVMYKGHTVVFSTYNGAKLKVPVFSEGMLEIEMKGHGGRLLIQAETAETGLLKAPKNGLMTSVISESVSAEVKVRFEDRHGNALVEAKSPNAGLEITDGIISYLDSQRRKLWSE